jgi:large conductance mechanosensitive channel
MYATASELNKFIRNNKIVGTSAGVCIALAAKDGIQSMVNDIIVPLILILLQKLNLSSLKEYLPANGKSGLDIASFIKSMITFILVILVSFIFVKFAFEYLLNVKQNENNPENTNINGSVF